METLQPLNQELHISLEEKLDRIRLPKAQNQREIAVVLSAVEDTLQDQQYGSTPTAYIAALLALLGQSFQPSNGAASKGIALSVVYLLDLVMPYVPALLLRQKFSEILISIAPVLTNPDIEAPLIKSSIGCIESLLIAQNSAAWALPQTEITPRRALSRLLLLVSDPRPKVRKRAQDAITRVLQTPPPSPSLDHPAADMCAEVAMRKLCDITGANGSYNRNGKGRSHDEQLHVELIHALRSVKIIATASGGWPCKKIEPLCRVLLNISKSTNEHLIKAAFEIFEVIFAGMADDFSSTKLPRLMEAITELRPSRSESQLLTPWIAVISRGYHISSQIYPEDTFCRLPEIFEIIAGFLASSSQNIRVSASECLISLLTNSIPYRIILEPSIYEVETFDKLARLGTSLLSIRYQAGWIEVFKVISTIFQTFKWRSLIRMNEVISIVGELRKADSFDGKKEADSVLGKAIEAMGPKAVLDILPLNLANPRLGQTGRAWLLPVLRDHIVNTNLAHFILEFVPLSEAMFQQVIDNESYEKTMEIKIFDTLIQQIWALLPGYCNLPLDLTTAFDKSFAELLANFLYQKVDLRPDICKALQMLVVSNKEIFTTEAPEEEVLVHGRVTKEVAKQNLTHLSKFAENLLAVLFNVYSETLPQFRGYILQSIDAYLSLTPEQGLLHIFSRVASLLRDALHEPKSQIRGDKQTKAEHRTDKMPPVAHTLMDLIITISIYLPRSAFPDLFSLAALLPQATDPQVQKKVYKILPRLAKCSAGVLALQDHSSKLQDILIKSASTAGAPCRRDRLDAIGVVIQHLPTSCLHFIPSILSEVVISTKEVNEKARAAAFDLLIIMARQMNQGGIIAQSKIPDMSPNAPNVQASLEEFITMLSAGLVGSSAHMVSASITALARILYEFHIQLSLNVVEDLIQTIDLFLSSPNREIVRSVLGFAKVAVIVLPEGVLIPRLKTLVPSLMSWSCEHKAQLRAKVKHLIERMIRRFGFELVYNHCPDGDRKFINNIRKAKERRKRKKDAAGDTEHEYGTTTEKRQVNFESEYDQAIYHSDESDFVNDDSETDASDTGIGRRRMHGATKAYILEGSEEPLDLLDQKALAHISSQKPVRMKNSLKFRNQMKPTSDFDGKLLIGVQRGSSDDNSADAMAIDGRDQGVIEEGIGAYADAISGRDAVQRGRGGRLKFSNKREKDGDGDIEVVGKTNVKEKKGIEKSRSVQNAVRSKSSSGKGDLQMRRLRNGGVGGVKLQQTQRRGLGVIEKVRVGRIGKSMGRR